MDPWLDNLFLYDDFAELRAARVVADAHLESFFASIDAAFWARTFDYINNQGRGITEKAHVACRICSIIRRIIAGRGM
jgi:hypothetical protein